MWSVLPEEVVMPTNLTRSSIWNAACQCQPKLRGNPSAIIRRIHSNPPARSCMTFLSFKLLTEHLAYRVSPAIAVPGWMFANVWTRNLHLWTRYLMKLQLFLSITYCWISEKKRKRKWQQINTMGKVDLHFKELPLKLNLCEAVVVLSLQTFPWTTARFPSEIKKVGIHVNFCIIYWCSLSLT